MIPRTHGLVIGHNDAHEVNVLIELENNENLMLIDFEYSGWNPAMYDLANAINEMAFDNNHPKGQGIKLYTNNFPGEEERKTLAKWYMCEMHKHQQIEEEFEIWYEKEKNGFMQGLNKCLALNNWMWGVWALHLLEKDQVTNDNIFNWTFAKERATFYKWQKTTL